MNPPKPNIPWLVILVCLVVASFSSACQPAVAAAPGHPAVSSSTAVKKPSATLSRLRALTPAPSSTPRPALLWLPPYLPQTLRETLTLPDGLALTRKESDATIRLDVIGGTDQAAATTPWVYALAAPFPTVEDSIRLEALQEIWRAGITSSTGPKHLLVDKSSLNVFEILWGPASEVVRVVSTDRLLGTAWKEQGTWAIFPFEQLEPRWKVIAVDGQSPVQKAFNPLTYGLVVHFGWKGEMPTGIDQMIQLPNGNRSSDRLTTVVLTGVTALVRGTASLMEGRGMTYPARDIGGWLREADILHISNEVPFAKNCPQPYDWEGLVFCSQTEYIQLLESIGTDVVELSGDHFQDWGPEATLYTIDLYAERGWPYYGGGRNKAEAQKPALFEHNSNKIAFIGCNAKPPGYSGASETTPGSVHCDFDQLTKEIHRLRERGYLPIVTFQHLEYYSYTAHPILQEDFRKVADAGAVIVSGSQAHQPHALEFKGDALLHYGLGNLFFDQTNQGDPPRTAFIDRHVFYAGRHISTELLTIYLVDYARSRPMTLEERQTLLRTVFDASGWKQDSP